MPKHNITHSNDTSKKTVMILAGGSGGHIYPALAVVEQLAKQNVNIVWIGNPSRLEGRITFPDYVVNEWIEIEGVIGKGLTSWLTMPFRLLSAISQALKIVNKHQPDLVFGTGGFVTGPGAIAAFIKRVPLIIHESNAIAGFTNKMLSKIATKTLVAMADTKALPKTQIVVGNPVRESLVELLTNTDKEITESTSSHIRISVIGGSQGAQKFNEILPEAIASITDTPLIIKHQTGNNKMAGVAAAYESFNKDGMHQIDVFEYVEDMASLYQNTDIIICRAGAMTMAEIAMAALPAIIIPYPNSAGDHQLENARYYQKQHAGILIEQQEMSVESMRQVIHRLINNPDKITQMSERAKMLASPNAAMFAANICLEEINA